MTAEEIRNSKNESDDGAWYSARWLQQIALQLAEANEDRRVREKATDQMIADAKEQSAGKTEFFDGLLPYAPGGDGEILHYLRSQGHTPEKAQQILTNHRGAVLAEMGAVPVVAASPAPDAEVQKLSQ